ncbi:MAG TPA: glycosyltransferase family 2 protein [Candidatus Binataceae bacterium]|nr:glycosyltransferase family 2 protein [Candidatus Binataceae bacterium]
MDSAALNKLSAVSTSSGEANCEVSIVMPCLDESETVGTCVTKALATLKQLRISGEVLVVDNGSSDGSAEIARRAGARVVTESRRGYGNALQRGVAEAKAPFIIMADADDSYDLSELGGFVNDLRSGCDLVMGSRSLGNIEPGAMPWLHRRVGNPGLSGILKLFFRGKVSDPHCGMRAFTKDAYRRMRLTSRGMEFASEMVIKAVLGGMRISEIPITLRRDGRMRHGPHLRSFRDGWRHLRYMLLLSPTHLFVIPGAICTLLGLIPLVMLRHGPESVSSMTFDYHYMILGSLLTILGFQAIMTGLFAKAYCHAARLYAPDLVLEAFRRHFTLERGLMVGALLLMAGFGVDAKILISWLRSGMGALGAIRPATEASTLMIIGAQIIFSSFFLSLLGFTAEEGLATNNTVAGHETLAVQGTGTGQGAVTAKDRDGQSARGQLA